MSGRSGLQLLFTAVLFLLLTACEPHTRGAIRFGLNTAPITLDPRYVTDAVSERICRLLYQRLIDFDAQYRAVPGLADWQMLSGSHYRFVLNDSGRQFHHGGKLTADDVKATFDSILDVNNSSPHRATLEYIESIRVVDENTIEFLLGKSDTLFPGRLNIGILPADLIASGHPFNSRPVGSGPVKFQAWNHENRLQLLRLNDHRAIEFITVKDPTVRVLKLARGEIDLIQSNLPRENIRWLEKQQGIRLTYSPGDIFTYIGFNLEDTSTGKLNVRRAIAHAIDREAIIRYVMPGPSQRASSLLSPYHWAANPELQGYDYDPERAQQLLRQSGFGPEKPLTLTFKTSSDPFRIRLATIIQDQLKKAGIHMHIRSFDWGTFYADVKQGRFQMYSLSWVGLKLPDIFRHVFHSDFIPPRGANRGRLDDPELDRLIEQAGGTTEIAVRTELYRAVQKRIHEQLPYVPLWYESNVLATQTSITGYTLATDGNYDAMIRVSKSSAQ
ncbi:MAG: ABC transporter substrate-binding protein [Thiotrichales bacterium]|nr:ABC transporter substrate-binding protein [Thiotrichales bacterium]